MKKDDTVRNLESKFDRETCCASGIDKKEIPEILQRYSDYLLKREFLDAISGCYERYKILKKR
jgi:hypothetical protein